MYDVAVVLLGIYPKEVRTSVHTKSCTGRVTAALFLIDKTWKQPRCPSVDDKLWCIWMI